MASSNQNASSNIVNLFEKQSTEKDAKHPIIDHFFNYFDPKLVTSDAQLSACYNLRHQIYCDELMHETSSDQYRETDEYDNYSYACLVQHLPSQQ
mgnify:CR=1 FL=1